MLRILRKADPRLLCILGAWILVSLPSVSSVAFGQEPTPDQGPTLLEGLPSPQGQVLPYTPVAPELITPESPLRPIPFGLAPPLEPSKALSLRMFLTTQEEFTDNAYETKNNRKSEYRTYISPGVSLGLDRPQTTMNLSYVPTFFVSDNHVQDNRVDQYLTSRGTWNPAPYIRFGLAEDLIYSSDFQAVQDLGSRRTGTTPYLTNVGSFEAAYLPPQGRLALSYTNVVNQQYVTNPDNSLTQTIRADGELTNPKWTVGTSYWLTRGDFDISSPYLENNLEARVRRTLDPTLSGTLYGLFTYHNSDQATAVDYILGRGRIGPTWNYSPTGSFEVTGGVDVLSPQNSPSPLAIAQTGTQVRPSALVRWADGFTYIGIAATYDQSYQANFTSVVNTGLAFTRTAGLMLTTTGQLFRDLTASLGVNWVENDYQLSTINVGSGTKDRTFNIDTEIRYYILRSLSLTLGYNFTIRNSTDPTAGFYENRVRFGLTYQFDRF